MLGNFIDMGTCLAESEIARIARMVLTCVNYLRVSVRRLFCRRNDLECLISIVGTGESQAAFRPLARRTASLFRLDVLYLLVASVAP